MRRCFTSLVLIGFAAACGSSGLSAEDACPPKCPLSHGPDELGRQPGPNPIPTENKKPGDPKWISGGVAQEGELDIYLTTDTAEAGDTVAARVNANPPSALTTKVYRLGYYGGDGARLVWQGPDVSASQQPTCPMDLNTGLLSCPWSDTFHFVVGKDWVSGLYLVKVQRPDGVKRFAPLVIRDHRAAELLLVSGSDTSEAYNRWGNVSLYWDGTGKLKKGRAYAVSYDRPYRDANGAGQLYYWEYWLARWLEENGYDVTYGTNVEFERFKDELQGIGMMIHGGHDEYWPVSERSQIEEWLSSTHMSLAYFGANPSYWRVRLEPGSGRPYRTITCYKDMVSLDPKPETTIRFRDEPNALPENALYGEGYKSFLPIRFPLAITNTTSWLFSGTGLTTGMILPDLVGVEYDQPFGDSNDPKDQEIAATSPVVSANGGPDVSDMVDRILPNGNLVFDAGSIAFTTALSNDPSVHDDRVGRLVLNVVERGLEHRRAPRALAPAGKSFVKEPAPNGQWASVVAPLAGVVDGHGFADGPGNVARFSGPTGLASMPDGSIVVADTNNERIRLIANDPSHTVSTIAGDGEIGARDGPGTSARFSFPTGVAVGPDGAVYVADQLGHAIRRVARSGGQWNVSTYAGALYQPGDVDGAAVDARFNQPTSLAFDVAGNLYVTDTANSKIKRIDAATHIVETVAGDGVLGDSDGAPGTSAELGSPTAIAIAGSDAYFVDANERVRAMTLGGDHAVTTIAGTAPDAVGFADGSGDDARFRALFGLAADAAGSLVLADTANYRLRLVVPGATAASTRVVTLAGTGRFGAHLGRGDVADLVAPTGVAVRPDGTVAVSDSFHNVIRLVTR